MPKHVVIDGSNLATEGRSMPSLKQLVEAVQAFMEEHPKTLVTVVVDATFGHRIDPREVAEFDAAIDHNELVAPPAGAVGRGDAFVLAIANKVNAAIVSNDSYQEFHGEYPWLFDEGRLIGGKPVPHVGWVFVQRVPVRGPLSRRSQREAKQKLTPVRSSKAASQPKPVPDAPPPGAVLPPPKGRAAKGAASAAKDAAKAPADAPKGPADQRKAPADGARVASAAKPQPAAKTDVPTPSKSSMINELLAFLAFVEQHPVGSPVTAAVESYSSHGAYVTVGDARGYVPLRNMADPPPRSAREAMKIGDQVDLVVVGFHAARRGIDLAVPGLAPAITGAPVLEAPPAPPAKRSRKKAAAAATDAAAPGVVAPEAPAAEVVEAVAPSRKRGAKKATSAEAAVEPIPAAPGLAVTTPPSSRRKRSGAVAAATQPAPPAASAATEPSVATAPRAARPRKKAAPALDAATEPAPAAAPSPAPAPEKAASPRRGRTAKATSGPERVADQAPPPATDRAAARKATAPSKRADRAPAKAAGAERTDGTAKKTPSPPRKATKKAAASVS